LQTNYHNKVPQTLPAKIIDSLLVSESSWSKIFLNISSWVTLYLWKITIYN